MLWRLYFGLVCLVMSHVMLSETEFLPRISAPEDVARALRPLRWLCLTSDTELWSYVLCFGRSASHVRYDVTTKRAELVLTLGELVEEQGGGLRQVYRTALPLCPAQPAPRPRTTEVRVECCRPGLRPLSRGRVVRLPQREGENKQERVGERENEREGAAGRGLRRAEHFIHYASEEEPCLHRLVLCSELVCLHYHSNNSNSITIDGSTRKNRTEGAEGAEGAEGEGNSDDTPPLLAPLLSPLPTSLLSLQQPPPTVRRAHGLGREETRALRERAREMFYSAYNAYLSFAYPLGELRPISCEGGAFDLVKLPAVSLIDALDTLVVLGNHSEFRRAVGLVTNRLRDFDFDVNVSLFETTIRILGGLLSAHLMAVDRGLNIYREGEYRDELLHLSVDLGNRLLPAFQTKTGVPYGTVNLRHGVPKGETKIASTAGAGSLLLEFQILSLVTGVDRYGKVALQAMQALFERRSPLHLIGKHINIETGAWHESMSGVGSNSDSFYEYMLKAYALYSLSPPFSTMLDLHAMFNLSYAAIKQFVIDEHSLFQDVDMFTGKLQRRRMESLDAFWPGLEVSLGRIDEANSQLVAFYRIVQDLSYLPEEIDYALYKEGKGNGNLMYPLRPELAESTYYYYLATRDASYLSAGRALLEGLDKLSTGCGYASVGSSVGVELVDSMPSFFLSETCKYLYLLFSAGLEQGEGEGEGGEERGEKWGERYLFTTEAHLFDLLQLRGILREREGAPSPSSSPSPALPSPPAPSSSPLHAFPSLLQKKLRALSPKPSLPPPAPEGNAWGAFLCPPLSYPFLPPLFPFRESEGQEGDGAEEGGEEEREVERDRERKERGLRRGERWWRFFLSLSPSSPSSLSKCPLSDGLSSSPTSPSPLPPRSQPPLKQVEVSMGGLGEFSVSVYGDGFAIVQRTSSVVLEVLNADKKRVLVRERGGRRQQGAGEEKGGEGGEGQGGGMESGGRGEGGEGGRVVIGGQGGTFTYCHVKLTVEESVVMRRPCSIATFSPLQATARGELALPPRSNALLCSPLEKPPQDQEGEKEEKGEEGEGEGKREGGSRGERRGGRELAGGEGARRWWWGAAPPPLQHLLAHLSSSLSSPPAPLSPPPSSSLSSSPSSSSPFSGKVVLVERGGCLFEEKARAALAAGARALVVRNSEDSLFIMAGREEVEGRAAGARAALAPSSPPALPLPVVMLSHAHGKELEGRARAAGAGGEVEVEVRTSSDVLQTELMGNVNFPKVFLGRRVIYSLSSQDWGAYFKQGAGTGGGGGGEKGAGGAEGEWQMYLLNKRDLSSYHLLPPQTLFTPSLRKVTSSLSLLRRFEGAYELLLRRKCPLSLRYVEEENKVVLTV